LDHDGTLAVLFLASWCPFCRRFQPAFEAAANRSGISWDYADVSDDDNILWKTFNIEIVPTVIVFKNGKPTWRRDGLLGRGLPADAIKETIDQMQSLAS
jgi:thioredoxin 1